MPRRRDSAALHDVQGLQRRKPFQAAASLLRYKSAPTMPPSFGAIALVSPSFKSGLFVAVFSADPKWSASADVCDASSFVDPAAIWSSVSDALQPPPAIAHIWSASFGDMAVAS